MSIDSHVQILASSSFSFGEMTRDAGAGPFRCSYVLILTTIVIWLVAAKGMLRA